MKRVLRSSIYAATSLNPRQDEYFRYLSDHISGVQDSWNLMLKPAMLENGYLQEDIAKADFNIPNHDKSKYDDEEFEAYCNYFYPSPDRGFSKNQKAFDAAWLRHIHLNPHHHQHWVLIRDEGELVPMDMPIEYVCEMLCDWHSFSAKDPTSTAYTWYQKNKKNMTLSDNTVKLIEKLIEYLKEPLNQEVI